VSNRGLWDSILTFQFADYAVENDDLANYLAFGEVAIVRMMLYHSKGSD
jgi:hypothetical protein